MAYTKTNWENDVTELSAENFNHIEDGIYNSTNLELYGVYNEISEVPTNTPNGKLFYLSSTNKIYEVTNTGAYHEFAEPISGIFYIVPSEQKNYAYDGTTLVSVGGGGSVTGDTLPIGAIIPFGGINAPAGWLICDGQAVSRTTYADLFSKIGTSFGTGDGSTTFNLPNLKGKVLVGQDTDQTEFNEIGKTGGEKEHTLSESEIPTLSAKAPTSTTSGSIAYFSNSSIGGFTGSGSGQPIATITGGGKAHNNLQPYTVGNYIIKASQTAGLVASVVNTPSTSDKDTYSCDYINKLIEYSTEEKVIGKWIDGKPIYRMSGTAIFGSTPKDGKTVMTIANMDTIISISGFIGNGTNAQYMQQIGCYFDSTQYSMAQVNRTTGKVTIFGGSSYANQPVNCSIEYTKTTD